MGNMMKQAKVAMYISFVNQFISLFWTNFLKTFSIPFKIACQAIVKTQALGERGVFLARELHQGVNTSPPVFCVCVQIPNCICSNTKQNLSHRTCFPGERTSLGGQHQSLGPHHYCPAALHPQLPNIHPQKVQIYLSLTLGVTKIL